MKTLAILTTTITLAAVSLGQTNPGPLYVHFGVEGADSAKRLLSARIHLGEAIFVSGNDYWKLTGRIEQRGTNLVADLVGDTGSQGQFYRGEIRLEKPFFGQGGAFSGGVVPIWFAVSTNSDSKPVLESLEKIRKQRLEKSR